VTTGEPVTISVEYENRGKAAVNRTVIQVFAGSKLLREDVLENFTDGDSGELSLNWTPDETEVGQRVLKVSIDPHNEISEETESNNEQTQTVTVIQSIIKDVSSSFKLRTTTGFGDRWYSDRYNLVPKSGPDMTYFQIYPESGGTYLLDVGIAGFRATKSGLDIYRIEVPDSSEDGWNSGVCVRDYAEGSDCIWMGPSMTFTIGFSRGDIVATDQSSVKSRTASSKSKVDEIELAAMTVADWPGTLKTFKVTGAGTPNKFVPSDFYSVQGSMIYVNPLIWNPETGEAKVATTYSFRITPK
jgi:hypothetical protein